MSSVPPVVVSAEPGRALVPALLAILLGIQLAGWFFFLPSALKGHADFRLFYVAAHMVRSGHGTELYDYYAQKRSQDALVSVQAVGLPFNHLAYEALIYLPLSFLNYRAGYFVFLLVNGALLAVAAVVLRPHFAPLAQLWRPLPTAMFVCFLPVGVALMQGQDSVLLLFLLALSFVQLHRRSDSSAGALLGLGLFKFQIVLPVALLFLIWKRWRFSAGFALSSLGCLLVSWWLVGSAQLRGYARSLVSMSVGLASQVEHSKYGISPTAMPNLRGLVQGLMDGSASLLWSQGVIIVLSLLVLLWAAARAPAFGPDALVVAILAAAAVSYHMLTHDLSIVLIPIGATLSRCLIVRGLGPRCALVSALLMFVAPATLAMLGHYYYLSALAPLALLFGAGSAMGRDGRCAHAGADHETLRVAL